MIDETQPPSKGASSGRSGARRGPPLPPVDQTSDTLHGFSPVTVAPPAAAPPTAAPDETHPKAVDPTIAPAAAGAGTLVPRDAAPAVSSPPTGEEPTQAAPPTDATLGGFDAATQAYHKAAIASAPKAINTGASFGHYELIEPIAKGGMGIVYKARQRNLNRIVAIKMILAGQFADQSDIDRFYAEAEAAAALSHPNIVAIHEIGEVQGQHFFSMDYIEGQSLADLVRENPLRPRRAAEFVRTIAETMQFAHDSGVVHRDLKPANVLLDKRQRPLITDFGLAKHVSGQSQRTIAGSIVGTPSYMPPEQAAGKIDEIGPWSDQYSLGAILYELLTGRPPFRSASPFETVRQVLETEPLSPRLLNENVPKDLETICLKCLQKERARRYASAQELADELGRFLRGEPIHARPISQLARFWRLCKRNPITASAIALAVLILIAATGVSTGFYIETSRALVKSDQSLQEAIGAVNEFFTTVSEDTLLNEPGMQPLRAKLLAKTKAYFERFLTQRANDPKVEFELAGAYYKLGKIATQLQAPEDAIKPYEKALEMQEHLVAKRPKDLERLAALGDTVNQLGGLRASQNDVKRAQEAFERAIDIREKLVAANPQELEYQRLLANTHMNIGSMAQAKGQYENARKQFEEAQRIRQVALQTAQSDAPETAKLVLRDLGMGFYNLGQLDVCEEFAGAAEHFKSAAEVFQRLAGNNPDDPGIEYDIGNQKRLASSYGRIGDMLRTEKPDEARTWYQRAIKVSGRLAQDNQRVPEYSLDWAAVFVSLSSLESAAGNKAQAAQALERARAILDPLSIRFKTVPRCQEALAITLRQLAAIKCEEGDNSAAAQNLKEAETILHGLVEQHGNEIQYWQLEVDTLRDLASVEQSLARSQQAIEHLHQAAGVMQKFVELYRKDKELEPELAQSLLAQSLQDVASIHTAAGDAKLAGDAIAEAIEILGRLVKKFPDDPRFKEQLQAAQKMAAAAPSP
jgi:eukaryotic-like serine/threonine-protein kinase